MRDSDARQNDNDSIWAVIGGIAKAYTLPINYVLREMSYQNVVMYGKVLPSYSSKKDNGEGTTYYEDNIEAADRILGITR